MKKTLCILFSVLIVVSACAYTVLAETEPTDEELYAQIDRDLHLDRVRGELFFRIADGVHIDELKQALIDMGLPSAFDNPFLYTGLFEDQPDNWQYGIYTVTVPEEIIRDVLFQMEHCDAIKTVFPNHIGSLDWIPHQVGDANADYSFDAKDYLFAKRAVLGTLGGRGYDEDLIDVNYDGKINARDCMLIKRAILGTATISPRPAPKDMNAAQFAHWLDDVTPYGDPPYKLTVCFESGVTVEQVTELVGAEFTALFCSTDYYPEYALWMVLELDREQFRRAVTNLIFCDSIIAWNPGTQTIIRYA